MCLRPVHALTVEVPGPENMKVEGMMKVYPRDADVLTIQFGGATL